MKKVLLGNEAIVRAALEAGVQFVSTYPGTPASEIGDIFEMRVWGYNIGSANAKGSQDLLNQYSSSTTRVINLFKMVPQNSTEFSKKDLPTTSERRHPPMYDPH